jgi:hypothetical protein
MPQGAPAPAQAPAQPPAQVAQAAAAQAAELRAAAMQRGLDPDIKKRLLDRADALESRFGKLETDAQGNWGQYDSRGEFHVKTSQKDLKEKEDKYTYQNMPGVGMLALHPTDPNKSRVIQAGQPPRPMTPDEVAAYGKGYFNSSGEPHVPNSPVQVLPGESETQKRQAALRISPMEAAVEEGKSAGDERRALAVMADAIAAAKANGGKLPEGKYGEMVQGLKSAARTFGLDFGNVPEGEILNKTNALLATAQAKALTSRPTQFDFQVMLERSPGLSQTDEGRIALIQIFDQLAHRRQDISRIATHKDTSPDNFEDKVAAYDAAHPILSPFTGRPMRKPEDLGMPDALNRTGAPAPASVPAPSPAQPAVRPEGPAPAPPTIGEVRKGHVFIGGDPADPSSWAKVR